MSAEVEPVLSQIALIQRMIVDPVSGSAVRAYDNVPYTISVADMPLFVTYVGPLVSNVIVGSDDRGREYEEVRQYNMVLYHSSFGSGIEGEKFGLLSPFFKLVYDMFAAYPKLKKTAGVRDAMITGDNGMDTVTFGNQSYYGITFTLQVTGRVRRLLAAGE